MNVSVRIHLYKNLNKEVIHYVRLSILQDGRKRRLWK